MYSIYVDLGYRDSTTITIVENSNPEHKAQFLSFREGLQWDEVQERLIALARDFKVDRDQFYIPAHPGMQAAIRRHLQVLRSESKTDTDVL